MQLNAKNPEAIPSWSDPGPRDSGAQRGLQVNVLSHSSPYEDFTLIFYTQVFSLIALYHAFQSPLRQPHRKEPFFPLALSVGVCPWQVTAWHADQSVHIQAPLLGAWI